MDTSKIRNIAIIAHVDHGKTTLVDAILHQSGIFRANQEVAERVMDSNSLERERGITIFSKNGSFEYEGCKINLIDTPGHADFGGEVQRILKMVDSVLLVVDAFEGPMPQTKYVLKNSLQIGLKPIVVINKIDRPGSRPDAVLDMVFDLFVELNASDEQLDFPVIYASAKEGFARYEAEDDNQDLQPLLDTIVKHVPPPSNKPEGTLQFMGATMEYDNYIGRVLTGKVHRGVVKTGQEVAIITDPSQITENADWPKARVTKLYAFAGLKKTEINEAYAGDIVAMAASENIDVGVTVTDAKEPEALPSLQIDEPTLSVEFLVNDSPFFGREGKFVTSRNIWDRLQKETESNVSLRVEQSPGQDSFIVKGRGELQISILMENMRREGYEFQVAKPRVIFKEDNGQKMEPIELATIDVSEEFTGALMEKLGNRKAEILSMDAGQDGYTRIECKIPARGLIGFRGEFLTDTRGTGVLNHLFHGYEPFKGPIPGRSKGVLIAHENGQAVAYALANAQERGIVFIKPATEVYTGMIIGESAREQDVTINVCKTKKLTNVRASGSDDAIRLTPPRQMSLEQALEYIESDELIEVTPENIRLRKKILNETERKRDSRKKEPVS